MKNFADICTSVIGCNCQFDTLLVTWIQSLTTTFKRVPPVKVKVVYIKRMCWESTGWEELQHVQLFTIFGNFFSSQRAMYNDTESVVAIGFCSCLSVFIAPCCCWLWSLVSIVGFRWMRLIITVDCFVVGRSRWMVVLVIVLGRRRWLVSSAGTFAWRLQLMLLVFHCRVCVAGHWSWSLVLVGVVVCRCQSSSLVGAAGLRSKLRLFVFVVCFRCWLSSFLFVV